MKAPESLETLIEYGIIEEVVRPLMSGKEAQVYLVVAGGEEVVAKVYKEANQRTFKHRSDYTEGRRTRNSRDQRAMTKRTQHGRKKDEDAWRSTEVDMIYRLRDAGVRVPEPLNFVEGVLVMELVKDADGHAAPRLGDLFFSPERAREIYHQLIREVVRMLCAGVIHGDLSEFNVLMSAKGPVVIDFPQSVDPTQNPNGEKLLLRDVENLQRFLTRFAPDERVAPYGKEIWSLFQANRLEPDTQLSGLYQGPEGKADTVEVMAMIEDASRDEEWRRHGRVSDEEEDFETSARPIVKASTAFRTVVDFAQEREGRASARTRDGRKTRTRRPTRPAPPASQASGGRSQPSSTLSPSSPPTAPAADSEANRKEAPAKRRRRRGRSRGRAKTAPESGDQKGRPTASGSGTGSAQDSEDGKRPGSSSSSRALASTRESRSPGAVATKDRRPRRRRRRPSKPGTAE